MEDFLSAEFIDEWKKKIPVLLGYLLQRWYLIILPAVLLGSWAVYKAKSAPPKYSATISFVLSTSDQRIGGLSGLAAQLGIDASTNGGDNIFTGDNIVELFKSRKIIRNALLQKVPGKNESLLNLIAATTHSSKKQLLPFPDNPAKFSREQVRLFRMISTEVAMSFTIFKRDKKLVFYYITATSSTSELAYYIAKMVLSETAGFFIETKTRQAVQNYNLMRREADSIANVIRETYRSSVEVSDRTFNLNPSVSVQRYSSQFNAAKANALSVAYAEVLRNLEIAKINVQKETPLYRIIDEPDLPLLRLKEPLLKPTAIFFLAGLFLGTLLLSAIWTVRNFRN
jgi:hypothetical protein